MSDHTWQPGAGSAASSTRHPGRIAAWLAKQVEIGLNEVDLSVAQYRLLCLLAVGPSMASALADRLDVRRPSVTAITEGLVNRGLVVRRPVQDDRRCVAHSLTDRGYRVLEAADHAVETRLEALADKLGDAERAGELIGGLDVWQQAMERHLATRVRTSV